MRVSSMVSPTNPSRNSIMSASIKRSLLKVEVWALSPVHSVHGPSIRSAAISHTTRTLTRPYTADRSSRHTGEMPPRLIRRPSVHSSHAGIHLPLHARTDLRQIFAHIFKIFTQVLHVLFQVLSHLPHRILHGDASTLRLLVHVVLFRRRGHFGLDSLVGKSEAISLDLRPVDAACGRVESA